MTVCVPAGYEDTETLVLNEMTLDPDAAWRRSRVSMAEARSALQSAEMKSITLTKAEVIKQQPYSGIHTG